MIAYLPLFFSLEINFRQAACQRSLREQILTQIGWQLCFSQVDYRAKTPQSCLWKTEADRDLAQEPVP
jgi:hypothetical protein